MKTFFEFYKLMKENMPGQPQMPGMNQQTPNQGQPQQPNMQAPQPSGQIPQGAGTSAPVPPPDPHMVQGFQAFGSVKDPKFQNLWQTFQKQVQQAGISVPGQVQNQNSSQPNQ